MPGCVGCSRVELGHELCALFERWYKVITAQWMIWGRGTGGTVRGKIMSRRNLSKTGHLPDRL